MVSPTSPATTQTATEDTMPQRSRCSSCKIIGKKAYDLCQWVLSFCIKQNPLDIRKKKLEERRNDSVIHATIDSTLEQAGSTLQNLNNSLFDGLDTAAKAGVAALSSSATGSIANAANNSLPGSGISINASATLGQASINSGLTSKLDQSRNNANTSIDGSTTDLREKSMDYADNSMNFFRRRNNNQTT